jgi:hypothetical protein
MIHSEYVHLILKYNILNQNGKSLIQYISLVLDTRTTHKRVIVILAYSIVHHTHY